MTKRKFTDEHRMKLEQYLAEHELPSGLGTEESACSIAAINLAVSGKLTDTIPDCMSKVLGQSTISLQDSMPAVMRNSERYKRLLPDMAGTGRDKEQERLAVLLNWMWTVVLPQLQPLADEKGFGEAWQDMCELKTPKAAYDAADAARAATSAADAASGAYVADVAYAVAYAVAADVAYAVAAADAARAATSAARAATSAADAADVAYAVAAVARAADADFWNTVDPIGVLERMTYLKGSTDA